MSVPGLRAARSRLRGADRLLDRGDGPDERRDVRAAVQEAGGALRGVALRRRLEGERRGMRGPAGEARLEVLRGVGAGVEVAGAGTAAEPLDAAADGEVDAQVLHVE